MDTAARLEAVKSENEMLRANNDELRERIAFLEDQMLGAETILPVEWRLTASEARVFGALLGRERCSKDFLMSALYVQKQDEAEAKIVDVFICKIRKKLLPFGIKIRTLWGNGYYLDPEVRKQLVEKHARPVRIKERAA